MSDDLVSRYKSNYHLPPETAVTVEMVQRHWSLERALAAELRNTSPETRAEVFERCYDTLYRELPWLNQDVTPDETAAAVEWLDVLGPPPSRVYEIGSGKGSLIRHLAARGYECRGSEITRERGKSWVSDHPNLSWGVTDGVHLDRFEQRDAYDAIISRQVIEHMHPDDLGDHLTSARALLRAGGRYLIQTPHRCTGPTDVSRLFDCEQPAGMHLREYTYQALSEAARSVGFTRVAAALRWPAIVRRSLGRAAAARPSSIYLRYLIAVERRLSKLSRQERSRILRRLRGPTFTPTIFFVATR